MCTSFELIWRAVLPASIKPPPHTSARTHRLPHRYAATSAGYYRGRGAIAAGATYYYVSRSRSSNRMRTTDCGSTNTGANALGLDRYEIDLPFSAPSGSGDYPLKVTIVNATVFVPRDVTKARGETADAWVSFYTSSGEWSEDSTVEDLLGILGWSM